jgi:hypothetical protein
VSEPGGSGLAARREAARLDQFDRDLAAMGDFEDMLHGA